MRKVQDSGMDIYDIRLANARYLLKTRHNNVQARMAEKLGVERQFVSNRLGKKASSEIPDRRIGSELARKFEATYKLPPGWMDNTHDELDAKREDTDTIDIPALGFDDGAPQLRPGDAMHLTRISKAWLRTNANFSSMDKLSIMTATTSDAMAPTIEAGAILLVDKSYGDVGDNGVYVITRDGQLQVRRLGKLAGGAITLICDNDRYPPETISGRSKSDIKVLGRVVTVWNTKKL